MLYSVSEAEATYGVERAFGQHESSSGESADQANAIGSAESYLEYSSFSRQGLYDQLIYEGFLPEEAEYGVNVAY